MKDDSEHPQFSYETEVEIEEAQRHVHDRYWDELKKLQIDEDTVSLSTLGNILEQAPIPQPVTLAHLLRNYASDLFEIAASRYKSGPQLQLWLVNLGERTQRIIEQRLKYAQRLEFHLSREEIELAISEGIEQGISRRFKRKRRVAIRSESEPKAQEKHTRLPSSVTSPSAARKLGEYLTAKGIGVPQFAEKAGTTDRTIRNFRRTGKVRRSIFDNIAEAMGITKDELLA